MLFTARDVPWYKLPLLGAIVLVAAVFFVPGMIARYLVRQFTGR